jgi:hypothetical protein
MASKDRRFGAVFVYGIRVPCCQCAQSSRTWESIPLQLSGSAVGLPWRGTFDSHLRVPVIQSLRGLGSTVLPPS